MNLLRLITTNSIKFHPNKEKFLLKSNVARFQVKTSSDKMIGTLFLDIYYAKCFEYAYSYDKKLRSLSDQISMS